MGRKARGELIDPTQVQIIHAVQRCVRRAFLCGVDPLTNASLEHRRDWIRDRLEFLSSVFGIDCLTYTVMHNHLHVVLRSRPDVVAEWNDDEVATRWLQLFPVRHNADGSPATPRDSELAMITSDPEVLAERRNRLSDISWWMRCLAENIAVKSNKEDDCTGRFWQGRFKSQLLLDEPSLLACAAYVDLNPIRAALAETPESSFYTGVKERIDDLTEEEVPETDNIHAWEREGHRPRSGWLSPMEIDENHDPLGPQPCPNGRRASDKGFLSCSLTNYLELVDWTGSQLREDKRGSIPAHLEPILTRMGLDGSSWCKLICKFGKLFKRAAGTAEHLKDEAEKRGQGWMQAPGNPLVAAG